MWKGGREGEKEGRQDAAVAEKWWSVKERGVACLSERGGKRKTQCRPEW